MHGRRRVSARSVFAPGPSGFEQRGAAGRARTRGAPGRRRDRRARQVTATINPRASPQIVVAGHADQIGLQVTWVDDQASCTFDKIGSIDPLLLPGRAVVIAAGRGAVEGVVGKRPTHLIPTRSAAKPPTSPTSRIDIGATNRAAALARIGCGDPITFSPHFVELADGFVAGRALDDRCGVYVAVRALEIYADAPGSAALTALSTVQEESRYMGAARPVAARTARLHDRSRRRLRHRPARSRPAPRGWHARAGWRARSCPRRLQQPEAARSVQGGGGERRHPGQIKATPATPRPTTSTCRPRRRHGGDRPWPADALHALAARGSQARRPRSRCRLVAAAARRLGEVFERGFFTPRPERRRRAA